MESFVENVETQPSLNKVTKVGRTSAKSSSICDSVGLRPTPRMIVGTSLQESVCMSSECLATRLCMAHVKFVEGGALTASNRLKLIKLKAVPELDHC